jgi:uncharacterized alpha-E superfamily protein
MLLGRAAASLYWISRYVERAENMARLLEVGYRISLMPRATEGHLDEWRSTLQSCGCEKSYVERYGSEFSAENVVNHMLFDTANPSSVRSCISMARNNGRAVRTALSRDVWEALNTTYNEMNQVDPAQLVSHRLPEFLDWVRQRSMLFHGAMVSTILRKDTFFFSQLGAHVERADSTARILDVKYFILLPETVPVGGEADNWQWSQVLRSVSAHRAYRWLYRDSQYTPWKIAEFMMLREEMPRSLLYCYRNIVEALEGLADDYGERHHCHDSARRLEADLANGDMEAIFQTGLHEFVSDFIVRNNALSSEIATAYNFP